MKHLDLISVIICSIILLGCNENNPPTDSYFTVDVTKSYPEKKLVLQDLFDVEYLALETTDEFVTTASLQYIDEDIIIMTNGGNSQTGNIYLVDRKSGKCLKTISHRGQSGEEYVFLASVNYDKENDELYIVDSMSQKVLVYDSRGNFKRTFKMPNDTHYFWINIFDRDHLICYGEPAADPTDSNFRESVNNSGFMLVSKQDGSVKKIQVPYERFHSTLLVAENPNSPTGKFYSGISNKPLIPYQESWILVEASSDTIYRYMRDHVKEPFIVRTPPIDSMDDPEIFLYPGIISDRYCFLQTVKLEYDFDKHEGFETAELVYDRTENTIYSYVIYNDDFTDKREMNMVLRYPNPPIIKNNDEVAFMVRMATHELQEAYENGKLKGKLKEIAAGLNEDSNPVIMIAKYKKSNGE